MTAGGRGGTDTEAERRSCERIGGGARRAKSIADLAEQEGVTVAYVCRRLSSDTGK
jgi:hypothetical protein